MQCTRRFVHSSAASLFLLVVLLLLGFGWKAVPGAVAQPAAGEMPMLGHIGGALGHLALPADHDGQAVLAAVGARVVRFEAAGDGTIHETWSSAADSGAITALGAKAPHVVAAAGWPDKAASLRVWRDSGLDEPRLVGRAQAREGVNSIGLGPDRAWLGHRDTVHKLDLADPSRPRVDTRSIQVPVAFGFPKVFALHDAGDRLWALAGPHAWFGPEGRSGWRLHGGGVDDEVLPPLVGFPPSVNELVVTEDRAWVAGKGAGLYALSLARATTPTILSRLPLSDEVLMDAWVAGLDVDGTNVLLGANGLHVFDGSDPASPSPLAHVPGPQSVDVVADDGVAWQSDAAGLLRRIALDDPAAPRETGSFRLLLREPRHVAIVGDVAWVVDRVDADARIDELRAVDISRPEQPRLLDSRMAGLSDVRGLLAAGERLLVVEASGEIKLIGDLDDAATGPTVVLRHTEFVGEATLQGDAVANADRAVVPTLRGLLVLEDVQGEARTRFLSYSTLTGGPLAMGLIDDLLWVALIRGGASAPQSALAVIDLNAAPARILLRQEDTGDLRALHGHGSLVTVAGADGVLTFYDGRETGRLRELGRLHFGEVPDGLYGDGDQVWLRTRDEGQAHRLWRIDVRDPAQPVVTGSTVLGDPIVDAAVSRGLGVAARGPAGLYLYGERGAAAPPTATPESDGFRIGLPWLSVKR